jgi:hypothetical protein
MKEPTKSRLVDIKVRTELHRGRPRDLATIIDAFEAQQDREWLVERVEELAALLRATLVEACDCDACYGRRRAALARLEAP